ncbi:transketolase [Mesoplasma lactucae]|uniref:Transketolase n=1 Tax=Mesoplasma lactucae ATCC 49193 TaxID=81460 RepID=A0A291IRJ7_9MOLU|nr:transketolase [Mesoplasma lactucae]ATG97403.1 transketolase [Mesoplasma lactucae ATCC 49193]ATZ20144.1 transketolase [Mesoplasma lactucae ATCC 49193]MCL8216892.1 Transketolase [Mesoplasma lactucae ATCC 49193]
MVNNKNNDNLNAIRILGVDMINKANSGHPGIVLDAAPMIYSLYANVMNINPKDPKWFNRDRFILSAGHGSALLYSILHLTGFDFSINDLKQFRQWKSKTPGHPEFELDGIEATTGPLGQGIAMGVGMASAEKFLAAKFNKPKFDIIDHFTYVICGDGDLQEGVAQEAISFAGKNQLHKLILLHDSNDVQLDDYIEAAQAENFAERFEAENWNTIKVEDGEDTEAITKAILQAQKSDKPTYIEVKTVIGYGASQQGTPAVHGAPIGKDSDTVRKNLGWGYPEFDIPASVYDFYKETTLKRGEQASKTWDALFAEYAKAYPNDYKELVDAINHKWNDDLNPLLENIPTKPQATRVSSGTVLNTLTKQIPTMIGGSADLGGSTKAVGPDGKFSTENPTGRNIMFGVREFAMGAICNGMACHGAILPFSSTFFVFSDYLKPAIRLAAQMKQQELYIFTHDSIAVGEDGPTHQPIEQLAMLRTIPNLVTFRPADYQETVAAYNWAVNKGLNNPSAIIATRQDLPELKHDKNIFDEVNKGAYILVDAKNPQVTLIATGSEVSLAEQTAKLLENNKIATRVVSMPSMELFNQQPKAYQDEVIDKNTLRVSIEMETTFGWQKYTGDNGMNFGIDKFGASAPGNTVISEYGFTPENISNEIIKLLK